MKFYTKQHKHYCGIDLHARSLYLCILDHEGKKLFHRNEHIRGQACLLPLAASIIRIIAPLLFPCYLFLSDILK